MRKEQTKEQEKYKAFNRKTKVITSMLLVVGCICLCAFLISFKNAESIVSVLFTVLLLAIWLVVLCVTASKFNTARIKLYEKAYGKEDDLMRTGLFKEIWEEFEWNQFEGLINGKVIFAETHNNTIELAIIRKGHEFNITVDKDALYMLMDDETDTPVECEIPLVQMDNFAQFVSAVREFVENV